MKFGLVHNSMRIGLIITIVFILLNFGIGGALSQNAQSNSGTVELKSPYVGYAFQINYQISGATITDSEDNLDTTNYLSNERDLKGVLESDQLRISGAAVVTGINEGLTSDLTVSITDDNSGAVLKTYTDKIDGSGEMKFDLTVPVSIDGSYSFDIKENCYMNYVHTVDLSGTLSPKPNVGLNPTNNSITNNPIENNIFVQSAFSDYILESNYPTPTGPGILVRVGTWKHQTSQDELVPDTPVYVTAFWEGNTNPIKPTQDIYTEEDGYVFYRWIFSDLDEHALLYFSPNSTDPYDPNGICVDVTTYGPGDFSHFTPQCEIFSSYPNVADFIDYDDGLQPIPCANPATSTGQQGSSNPASSNSGLSPTPTPNTNPSTLKPGSIWDEKESGTLGNWEGTWTVRSDGKTIDASWSGGHITDVIDIQSINGNQIILYRHGNNGIYTGTISQNGLSMSGTASWYPPGNTWTASIESQTNPSQPSTPEAL